MRKFQKLMLSHRCVCVYVCWSTCISTTVKMNSEPKKNITGFFKKNSHPQETTEIPCLPPQPPTSMLWSEVPNIINRNGCFFWRPPNTKFRRQHWIGGRGEHDLCGVVLHGMAVFFEEPGMSARFLSGQSQVATSHRRDFSHFWISGQAGIDILGMCIYPIIGVPSGELTFCHGKIHHFSWDNPLFLWPFSIAMLVHQRVLQLRLGMVVFDYHRLQPVKC